MGASSCLGEIKGLLIYSNVPKALVKFFHDIHSHFARSQRHEKIGFGDCFVVLVLRSSIEHPSAEIFPNVQMQKDAFVNQGLAFPMNSFFKLPAICLQFNEESKKDVDFIHGLFPIRTCPNAELIGHYCLIILNRNSPAPPVNFQIGLNSFTTLEPSFAPIPD